MNSQTHLLLVDFCNIERNDPPRKESSLPKGKIALLPNLRLPPTNLPWQVISGVGDYRWKGGNKKAEPFDPALSLLKL